MLCVLYRPKVTYMGRDTKLRLICKRRLPLETLLYMHLAGCLHSSIFFQLFRIWKNMTVIARLET